MGAAGTKIPTTRVSAHRCGADWSGWLDDAHPTVEDVKVKGRSALGIVLTVTNMQSGFQLKIVDPTSSTNFTHLPVTHATVVQIECEAKDSRNKRNHKLILRYTYFRDFAKSSMEFLL